jgi:CarD family transcriptional regulator
MSYAVGDTVIYPNHGAAVIDALETRRVNAEDKTYLVLRVLAQNGLLVRVPTASLGLVGVREVVDRDGLQRVLNTLRAEPAPDPANWSRRSRQNIEKLRTGCVIRVAEVVRDLWRRDRSGDLSATEGRMLAQARQILVSELAECHQTNYDEASALLDRALAHSEGLD